MAWQTRTGGAEWATTTAAASAARKAVLMLAAAGHAPTDGMTEGERKKYRRQVDTAATGIMMLSLVFGLTAPSSPQLMTGEVSDFARELGITGFTPAFYKELQNMEPDEDYMDVYLRWVERDPDKAIFTVSQSKDTGQGFWRTVDTVDTFIADNKDLLQDSPLGLSYFSPTTGIENVQTNQLLISQGLKTKRSTDEYMTEIVEAQGTAQLRLIEADYAERRALLDSTRDAEELTRLENATKALRADIKAAYGLSGKESDAFWNVNDYVQQWNEISAVQSVLAGRGNELALWAAPLVDVVASTQTRLGRMDRYSPDYEQNREDVRAGWRSMMEAQWRESDGDEQKQNLLRAATYAVWGPSGTTWPWSKPETSDQ